ncbi:hypothetical protein [Natronomonas moolapensis]|uniref:hypothetical protein n=1 Tax=Natronomonas moolapensis TaxID=416273 RepID=UPI00126020E9|nr:hypothetical protein [Natronomonas moolapensis]
MGETIYQTVRLERVMKTYINEACENLDSYHSIKHFCEQAVLNNISAIEQEVKGAADLKRLVQALSRVDSIELEFPKKTFNTKIANQKLATSTKVELPPQVLASVDETANSTAMSNSSVVRACIIGQLYEISSSSELLYEPRRSDIKQSWYSIKNNIDMLYSMLVAQLKTKFIAQWQSTQRALEHDKNARQDLIAHYQNYFKDSVGYERLQESKSGEEILSNLEALPHGTG